MRLLKGFDKKDRKFIAKYARNNPQMHVVVVPADDALASFNERVEWLMANIALGRWAPITQQAVSFHDIKDAIHYKLRFVG